MVESNQTQLKRCVSYKSATVNIYISFEILKLNISDCTIKKKKFFIKVHLKKILINFFLLIIKYYFQKDINTK